MNGQGFPGRLIEVSVTKCTDLVALLHCVGLVGDTSWLACCSIRSTDVGPNHGQP